MTQQIKEIKVSELRLWSENPRDPIDINSTDFDVIKRAVDTNPDEWNLNKLIDEMGNYYDFSEIPTVVYLDKVPVVFDGNRRIAVLKYLQNRDLFSSLTGRLFLDEGPKDLRELSALPCNVCDKETALNNIERKHVNSGSWGTIQREYFVNRHRGKPKSPFLIIDEQTGFISSNKDLNQGFVKDEVLSDKNLNDIGFGIKDGKFISVYEDENHAKNILQKVSTLVKSKDITTRKNRGQLLKPLLEKYPDVEKIVVPFNSKKDKKIVVSKFGNGNGSTSVRRTSISQISDKLFGKKLALQSGPVNDLYCAISDIYEQFNDKKHVLPVVGMSLRLILDVGGRLYYKSCNQEVGEKDQVSGRFLKDAKTELKDKLDQKTKNSASLTLDWVSNKYDLEGILHKYAHGNIDCSKDNIVLASKVVGNILEHYFKKQS